MLKSNPMRTPEYIAKYEKAKDLYLNHGYSLTQAGKETGLDRKAISRCLKEEGYEVINRQNATKFNDKVFDKIDSEEKAYWLGFLYADGYVESNEKRNNIELSLKSSDIGHLEKFKDFLQYTVDKHIFQDDVRCRINVTNKRVKQQLIKLGCTPRKSLTLTFPSEEQVPSKFIPDFVRGYIDGDGSVMIGLNYSGQRVVPRLSVLGTYDFLDALVKKMGWKENKIHKKPEENVFTVEWGGQHVLQYLDQMYGHATIYLDRKYEKYLTLQEIHGCRSKE